MASDIAQNQILSAALPWWRRAAGVIISITGASGGIYLFWNQFETTIGRAFFIFTGILIFISILLVAFGSVKVEKLEEQLKNQNWKMKSEAAEGFLSTESDTIKRDITFHKIVKFLNLENPENTTWTETYHGTNVGNKPMLTFNTKINSEDLIKGTQVMFKHEDQENEVEIPIEEILDKSENDIHKSHFEIPFPEEYSVEPREKFELTVTTDIGHYNLEEGSYNHFKFNNLENQATHITCKIKLPKHKAEQLNNSDAGLFCSKFVGTSSGSAGRDLASINIYEEYDLTKELLSSKNEVDNGTEYKIDKKNIKQTVYVINMLWS